MVHFGVIIQARSGSTRFPGKCLKTMPNGKSLVEHVYTVVNKMSPFTIVAVPRNDEPIINALRAANIPHYCGSEEDVLDRFYQCAKAYGMQMIGRVTADCYAILDSELFFMTNLAIQSRTDFASNTFKPKTCYEGTDYEIMSFRCLEWLHKNTNNNKYREHCTNFIYEEKEKFLKTGMTIWDRKWPLKLDNIKTSIDTEEDFIRAKEQGVW
jgi:spore coat polysaccharide biosynthesis protein SpsF